MDKFMQQMREAFANEALWKEFQTGIWDTIYSTVAATLVACVCLLYTSPSPRDRSLSRMPSSA